MPSLDQRLSYLEDIAAQLEQGAFTMPTALGPNKLSKNTIKGKSITGVMIDANDLSAVKTNTGSLSVTGNLTIGTGGSLRSGKTAYTDTVNPGYFIGLDSGTPKIRVGNAGHTKGFVWDGTDLIITGTITATSGTIGGWSIGATDLTADSGATGIASSGSYRLWIGDATPSLAEFSVTSAGAMSATSGSIGGWTIDSINGLKLGTTTSTRGISTGSIAFYAGNATPSSAPFRVTTGGAITAESGTIGGLTLSASSISGTNWSVDSSGTMTSTAGTIGGLTIGSSSLTVPSGKQLKFGASAADYLDNNILHFEVGAGETGKVEFRNGSIANYSYFAAYSATNLTFLNCYALGSTNRKALIELRGTDSNTSTYVRLNAYNSSSADTFLGMGADGTLAFASSGIGNTRMNFDGNNWVFALNDAAGSYSFKVNDSAAQTQFGISSNGAFTYPDADGTALGTYAGRIPWYVAGNLRYVPYYN